MAVTVEQLHARVQTDLDTETLQRILDAAVKAIDRAAGKADEQVETKVATNTAMISVHRPIASITSVEEYRRLRGDPVNLNPANDVRQVGPYRLLRLEDGDNPAGCFGQQVTVTYVPEVDQDVRDRVTLDIAQVDLKFDAYAESKSGSWEGKADWKKERAALLKQVREGRSPII